VRLARNDPFVPMRVVIVGGGFAGLALARGLARRGVTARVLERQPASSSIPGPIMLPFQAFDPLTDLGVFEEIRPRGRDIAPQADGTPVAIAVARQLIAEALREGVTVEHERRVEDLRRDGDRIVGVRAVGPGGAEEIPLDLVVGADGTFSSVRDLAGIAATTRAVPGATLSFRSPIVSEEPFAMTYLADGRQVGFVSWPDGTAGWWQIDKVGRDAAIAPGVEAYREGFARLLPSAGPALAAVESPDQLVYREVTEVRCERWWVPGAIVIGEAAHAIDPETGIGSGLGMGDAVALAVAIAAHPDDPDAACAEYERWRRPAIAPYEAIGAEGTRIATGTELPPEERWPPPF